MSQINKGETCQPAQSLQAEPLLPDEASWFLVFGGVRHRGEHPSCGMNTKGNED